MLSAATLEYTARAIIQQIAGNTQKVEEYCSYINKAIEIYREEPEVNCRYKKNGQWVQARINWDTEVVKDLNGQILWGGKKRLCG